MNSLPFSHLAGEGYARPYSRTMQTDSFCKRNILMGTNEGNFLSNTGLMPMGPGGFNENEIRSRAGSTFEIKDVFSKDNNEDHPYLTSSTIYGRPS
jgi:hypothetical protein